MRINSSNDRLVVTYADSGPHASEGAAWIDTTQVGRLSVVLGGRGGFSSMSHKVVVLKREERDRAGSNNYGYVLLTYSESTRDDQSSKELGVLKRYILLVGDD